MYSGILKNPERDKQREFAVAPRITCLNATTFIRREGGGSAASFFRRLRHENDCGD